MNELALFAGAGGGILGGVLLGWRTVCAVELNAYCARRLMQRQNEGHLPPFPIWDDVRSFDGHPWRGRVDVVSGGFPCQDISVAGKGAGISGARSGLWREFARIIREVRPRYAFVENSPALTIRGLGTVLRDLAEMGMDARWGVLGGFAAGLCIKRERIWIVCSSSDSKRLPRPTASPKKFDQATSSKRQLERAVGAAISDEDHAACYRNPDDMARGMDRLRAIGNGQVPLVVELAWEALHD